jgi:thiol-disulfide isomerase/thioredoxin
MKKLVIILFLTITSVGLAQGKIIKFKADIKNVKDNVIEIWGHNSYIKKIKGDGKGQFETTLDLKKDLYAFSVGGPNICNLYLKEGDDISVKADANKFVQSLTFTGKGAAENNYMANKSRQEDIMEPIIRSEDKVFKKAIADLYAKDLAIIEKSNFDPHFMALMKENLKEEEKYFKDSRASYLKKQKYNNTMAVSFDYENYKGGKSKLEDFKGKYVYIDVWATWCGPCVQEIPYLKEIEKKYHKKNIAFISISIDGVKDFKNWKSFVKNNKMGGIQLFATKNATDRFIKTYQIVDIPRFILIDPKGKIIDADAYRPSSPQLIKVLDKYLK